MVALVYHVGLVQVKRLSHLLNPALTIYDITLVSGHFRKILLVEFFCVIVIPAYYCIRAHTRRERSVNTRVYSTRVAVITIQLRGKVSFFVGLVNYRRLLNDCAVRADDSALMLLCY